MESEWSSLSLLGEERQGTIVAVQLREEETGHGDSVRVVVIKTDLRSAFFGLLFPPSYL